MNSVGTWGGAISSSVADMWGRLIGFIPSLIGAIIIFLVGFAIAVLVGKAVEALFRMIKIDKAIDRIRLAKHYDEAKFNFRISQILGSLVKWFLVLIFLMAAADILGLTQLTQFLNSVLLYLPNVAVAVIILYIAFVLGNFVHNIVQGSTRTVGTLSSEFLAAVSKWAIIIFGILAALIQLGIAPSLVNTIFVGLVGAVSLAAGLAFGLGGKDEASIYLRKIRESMQEKV